MSDYVHIDYAIMDRLIKRVIDNKPGMNLRKVAIICKCSNAAVSARKKKLYPGRILIYRSHPKDKETDPAFMTREQKVERLVEAKAELLGMPETWVREVWLTGPAGRQAMEQMP